MTAFRYWIVACIFFGNVTLTFAQGKVGKPKEEKHYYSFLDSLNNAPGGYYERLNNGGKTLKEIEEEKWEQSRWVVVRGNVKVSPQGEVVAECAIPNQGASASGLPEDWMYQEPFRFKIRVDTKEYRWLAYPKQWMIDGCDYFRAGVPYPQYSLLDNYNRKKVSLWRNLLASELAIEDVKENFARRNIEEAKKYYRQLEKFKQTKDPKDDPSKMKWNIITPEPFYADFVDRLESINKRYAELEKMYPDEDFNSTIVSPVKIPLSKQKLLERVNSLPVNYVFSEPPFFSRNMEDVNTECYAMLPDSSGFKIFIQKSFEKTKIDPKSQKCDSARSYKSEGSYCYSYVYNVYLERKFFFREGSNAYHVQESGSAYFFVTNLDVVKSIHADKPFSLGDPNLRGVIYDSKILKVKVPVQQSTITKHANARTNEPEGTNDVETPPTASALIFEGTVDRRDSFLKYPMAFSVDLTLRNVVDNKGATVDGLKRTNLGYYKIPLENCQTTLYEPIEKP